MRDRELTDEEVAWMREHQARYEAVAERLGTELARHAGGGSAIERLDAVVAQRNPATEVAFTSRIGERITVARVGERFTLRGAESGTRKVLGMGVETILAEALFAACEREGALLTLLAETLRD